MSELQWIYNGLLVMVSGFCIAWGGPAERLGAAVAFGASMLSWLVWTISARHWSGTEYGVLSVDLAVLFAFLAMALKSNRFWPLWATSFQLISVATHAATLVDPDIVPRAYGLAQGFWAYPILLMMAFAAHLHARRAGAI